MNTARINFDNFNPLPDVDCHQRIRAARAKLGQRAVILGHHYQRSDVYQYADLTGDSLKLSRLAAQTDAEYIVFCGVHFMAEVADFMSKPHQKAILPDLAAGCSMAVSGWATRWRSTRSKWVGSWGCSSAASRGR